MLSGRFHVVQFADFPQFDEAVGRMYDALPSHEVVHGTGSWCYLGATNGDALSTLLPTSLTTSVTWQPGAVILPLLAAQRSDRVFVLQLDHGFLGAGRVCRHGQHRGDAGQRAGRHGDQPRE